MLRMQFDATFQTGDWDDKAKRARLITTQNAPTKFTRLLVLICREKNLLNVEESAWPKKLDMMGWGAISDVNEVDSDPLNL